MDALIDFVLNPRTRNCWLKEQDISIYVRKSERMIEGSRMRTLDVANIFVNDHLQRKGIFTKWLQQAEVLASEEGFDAVFVESILNPHLFKFLEGRGYTKVAGSLPPCYYLMVNGTASSASSQ